MFVNDVLNNHGQVVCSDFDVMFFYHIFYLSIRILNA